jgi:hypothetical protein
MNRNQLIVLAIAVVATIAMLLYPPYMMGLTGSHMGYYFALQLPVTVSTFGTVDAALLALQIGVTWITAVGAILGLRSRDD